MNPFAHKGFVDDGNGNLVRLSQPRYEALRRESELHADILSECRARGWLAFHGAMNQRTARTVGEPDFIILADNGRVLFVECKTAKGKLSTEQIGVIAWAKKLAHVIHVARSLKEFLEIVNGLQPPNRAK